MREKILWGITIAASCIFFLCGTGFTEGTSTKGIIILILIMMITGGWCLAFMAANEGLFDKEYR